MHHWGRELLAQGHDVRLMPPAYVKPYVKRGTRTERRGSDLRSGEAEYGGMDVSQARKLKVLEEENGRLKRLLADAMLDNAVLKEVAGKSG